MVVVEEEEGVMPSTCSLGNLSNLESCQDTERLSLASSDVYPHLYTSEGEEGNQENRKRGAAKLFCSLF